MFKTLLGFIKGVLKMFRKTDIKTSLGVDVAISQRMIDGIELWSQMYKNHAPWLSDTVKSMNLSSAIASEIARLVTIEMKAEVTGSSRADYLNNVLQDIVSDLRKYVEFGCAKGGLIMKPLIDNGQITVDYVQADCFFPTAFSSSGDITGCAFLDQLQKGDYFYTRIEYHNLTDKGYEVQNKAYTSQNKADLGREIPLSSVDEWNMLEPYVIITGITKPLFAYFKVPQANNIDTHSPLGVSVYARTVDLIEQADKQYSRLLWEFESGERALYVDTTAFRKDKDGNSVLPDKRLYKEFDIKDLYQDFTPTLREQNILNGLDAILIKIEDTCGLARGTFSNPQTEAKTATELKILRQRSYATVADTQKSLQKALNDLMYACDIWCTLAKLAPQGKYETSFEWDDSIIADRQAEYAEKLQLVNNGIMSKEKFYAWYFGVSEEQAKKELPQENMMLFGDETATEQPTTQSAEVGGKSLNGAQTQSLIAIMAQFTAKQISEGQAINLISTAIGISKDEARAILNGDVNA